MCAQLECGDSILTQDFTFLECEINSEFQVEGKSGASSRGNTSSTRLYNYCCG